MIRKNAFSAVIMALFLFAAASELLAEAKSYPKVEKVFTWNRQERLSGFKNVEKLTPTRTVETGGQVRPLAAASSKTGRQLAAALDRPTAEFMKTGDIVGVIIIHNDEIIIERYAHGFGQEDRWTSFSVAKSITATLAGAALNDGLLKLDDQVVQYVPELKGSAYDGVTVRHLLTMTSGVRWNENYTDPKSDVARLTLGVGDGPKADPLKALAALPREAKPGREFSYKTGESNLLGLVVSRAAGKPLAEYLSEKIWRPYGMEKTAFWAIDGQGRELGGCCLSMCLRDYARVGLFMLEGGQADGRPVLSAAWLKEATSDVTGHNYGYQWRVLDKNVFAATGIFGQMIAIDRGSGSVAVILSAWNRPLSQKANQERFDYLRRIKAIALKNAGKKQP